MNKELIKEIYDLSVEKEKKEFELNNLKTSISELDTLISAKKDALLADMLNEGLEQDKEGDLIASVMHRPNVGYSDEAAVIAMLKESFSGNYTKTKITESIDKNALKKALKTDIALASALAPYVLNSTTDYVVVTDEANYQKMLEHINKGK